MKYIIPKIIVRPFTYKGIVITQPYSTITSIKMRSNGKPKVTSALDTYLVRGQSTSTRFNKY